VILPYNNVAGTHIGLEGGYVGAWEDWKIPASEISLGTVISCTKREIIYRYVHLKGEHFVL